MGWIDRIKGWLGSGNGSGAAAPKGGVPGLPVVIKDRRGRILIESRDHTLKALVEHGCADNQFPLADAALGGMVLDELEGRSGDWRGADWPRIRMRRAKLTDIRAAMADLTGSDFSGSNLHNSHFDGRPVPLPDEIQPISSDLSRMVATDDAANQIAHWQRHSRPVVAISGDFDVFDRRTLGLLREARALGAQLVVVLNEGEGLKPVAARAAALLGQPEVSLVVSSADALKTISELKPAMHAVWSHRATPADGVASVVIERTGAILDGADLTRVAASDSDMRGVSMIGTKASRSNWENAKFDGATISLSTAKQMNLRGATGLNSVTLVDDAGKRLSGWELTENGPRKRPAPPNRAPSRGISPTHAPTR